METIPDTDTTYRVPGTRLADLKARALAAYFAPDEIRFLPKNVKGGRALAFAYLTARAVMDRLDAVLGVDGWTDHYETMPNNSVRCSLAVKLDGENWITKQDVGGPSEQPDESDRDKAAHSDALKRAAVKFGVGRYLYLLPQTWGDYDMTKKTWANPPALPLTMVPTAYRPYDSAKRNTVQGLLRACLEKAKVQEYQHKTAAVHLLADYGYKPTETAAVQNRHADAMIRRLNEWMQEIAKGNANCPVSPLYSKDAPQSLPVAPPKAEQPTVTQPAAQPAKTRPASGAEFLARMELKDRQLSDAGRCQRDALKAHIIAEGAKAMLSADVVRWGQDAIGKGMKWAQEFIDSLPDRDDQNPREEQDSPGYATA